jgi:hypothetical protein
MTTNRKFFTILIPALMILFLLTVQAYHFHDRPYRQDEAWVVHYGIENIQRVGFVNHNLQIFSFLLPENFLQDIWVQLFGHVEQVVRYLSTLTTFLTLAMAYRLGSDLVDRQTGRLTVIILGTLSIFMFFTHEARPYAALAFGTVGFMWALLRFIHRPNWTYAILALSLSVIPFYQHPFLLYVFAGQVACVLVFVRWNRGLYLRGVGLFVALAVLIGARLIINFADRSGTITYGTATSLDGIIALYEEFKFNPESLGVFLFGLGIFLPMSHHNWASRVQVMRFGQHWRKWWVIAGLGIILLGVLGVNAIVESVTPRNLIIIAPFIALIAAYGLRQLPWQAHVIASLMLVVPYATQFRSHMSNAGYPEVAQYINDNYDTSEGRLMIIANQLWEWIPIKYYLDERTDLALSNTDVFLVSLRRDDLFAPQAVPESNAITDSKVTPDDAEFARMIDYLGDYDKLWVIYGNPFQAGETVQAWIDEHYSVYHRVSYDGDTYYRPLEVVEYRRHPDDPATVVRFGDDILLADWELNDAVNITPCQTISVDTWWQTDIASDAQYSSTLVIADANGQGLANADDMPGGVYTTPRWQTNALYFDERHLTIPCDIASGSYNLLLGVYDISAVTTDGNLPVNTADGEPLGTTLYYLTTLTVD